MPPIKDRRDWAAFLLALGLTPDEASKRLYERLGIEYSADYLRNARYFPEWKERINCYREFAPQIGQMALIAIPIAA